MSNTHTSTSFVWTCKCGNPGYSPRIGMAAAALQRGGWGLRLWIADIMSICASKIHVKLGCCQKVHLPGHFHIATWKSVCIEVGFRLVSLPLTTAIAPWWGKGCHCSRLSCVGLHLEVLLFVAQRISYAQPLQMNKMCKIIPQQHIWLELSPSTRRCCGSKKLCWRARVWWAPPEVDWPKSKDSKRDATGNGDIDYFTALVLVCQRKQQKCQGIQVNQHRGWREAMQTGATNLLNIDFQRDGMHDIAPCSSPCCKFSRNDHAMRSHERSQWGELRSLGLSFCRVSAWKPPFAWRSDFPYFPEHPRVSVQFVVCSWRTLTLRVRVDSFGSQSRVLAPKTPQVFPCWTPSL